MGGHLLPEKNRYYTCFFLFLLFIFLLFFVVSILREEPIDISFFALFETNLGHKIPAIENLAVAKVSF